MKKPLITVSDVQAQSENAPIVDGVQRVPTIYRNPDGCDYSVKLRLTHGINGLVTITCPLCGNQCAGLYAHPEGRGAVCIACANRAKAG